MLVSAKTAALLVAFTAITIVLNPLGIPAPYLLGFIYRLWDIPIIAAFFLFGFKFAVAVAFLNGVVQLFLFPRPMGILAPIWLFMAVFSLLLGLCLAKVLVKRRVAKKSVCSDKRQLTHFTALGILSRTAILPFVDYAMYRYLLPLVFGDTLADSYILAMMPGIVLFIFTETLLQAPIAFLVAKAISKNLRVGTQFP